MDINFFTTSELIKAYLFLPYPTDRVKYKYFTPYLIAATNNTVSCVDIALKLLTMNNYSVKDDNEFSQSFKNVLDAFENLRKSNIDLLLKDLFLDIEKGVLTVGSKEWLEDSRDTTTESVKLTIEDYAHDYKHLKEKNFQDLRTVLEMKLATCYLQALLHKKITFKDVQQREKFARKFESEIAGLKNSMAKLPNFALFLNSPTEPSQSPFDCFPLLTEFLKLKDINNMLYLEVSVSSA